MIYDTIVIGRGPAGISCATYLKRFNLNPLIIAKDNGALEGASLVDNYYGEFNISGHDLVKKGISQALALGIDMVEDEVISIEKTDVFHVVTKNNTYQSKSIFLAMGKKHEVLPIKNKNLFDGRGVSYCAICDGFFFRNKKIGIVGSGAYMESELNVLKRFSNDITVFTNGDKLSSNICDKVVEDKIVDLIGNDRLKSVKTTKEEIEIDGLFIALGSASGRSLAYHLGLLMDSNGYLITKDYMTNIDGIFAGGDLIGGLLQVSKAASDGALASMQIKKYLDK